MRQRFAPLVPLALIALLTACAGQSVQTERQLASPRLAQHHPLAEFDFATLGKAREDSLDALTDEH
ncbi:MAG: peptidoglycan endopeptidase, partial [Pseudomonas sp.]